MINANCPEVTKKTKHIWICPQMHFKLLYLYIHFQSYNIQFAPFYFTLSGFKVVGSILNLFRFYILVQTVSGTPNGSLYYHFIGVLYTVRVVVVGGISTRI